MNYLSRLAKGKFKVRPSGAYWIHLIKYIKMVICGLLPHRVVVLYGRYKRYGTIYLPWNQNTTKFWNVYYKTDHQFPEENYLQIPKLLDKNSKFSLLDVGCGGGEGCNLIKTKFPNAEICGTDFSSIAIKKAKKLFRK